MPKPNAEHLKLLYQALHADVGIEVFSNDPERLRTRLYIARKDSGDPDLGALSIIKSRRDPTNRLWICHAEKTRPADEALHGEAD